MLKQEFLEASTFADFLESAQANQELWRAVYQRAQVPQEFVNRVSMLTGRWKLLILHADWCGDAVNIVPVVVKLVEAAPKLEVRVLDRDSNPDLMDRYLTAGSRSIPVVIALDEKYDERGWWGPRPTELQRWVVEQGLSLPKEERYREVRRWYARDRGRAILEEVTSLLEQSAAAAAA